MVKPHLTREEFLLYEQARYLQGVISRHLPNETRCRGAIVGCVSGAFVTAAATLYEIIRGQTVPSVYFGIMALTLAGKVVLSVQCPERKLSIATRKELEEIKETPVYAGLMDKLEVIKNTLAA